MEIKIEEIFKSINDPRVIGRCAHKLSDILMIGLCSLLADGEDFEDMVIYGKEKETFLRTFLEFPNGIPSHDTFNRAFKSLIMRNLIIVLVFMERIYYLLLQKNKSVLTVKKYAV